jgi:hypothetical protein
MRMSESCIEGYGEKMRGRYGGKRGKQARSRLLDEFVEITGRESAPPRRDGAGKRSQWDRKEKEYALGGKPQTET